MIRLSRIDSQVLASEVVDTLAQWIANATFRLAPRFEFREASKEAWTDLGPSVQALCEYAQRGLPVWDWQTVSEPLGCLNDVTTLFFGRVADYGKDDLATSLKLYISRVPFSERERVYKVLTEISDVE